MLESLKERVYEANLELVRQGLVILTWGNVSGKDKESGLVVIKPSGVPYHCLSPKDMVVVNQNGLVIEGGLRPSSDTATHLELYKAFPDIHGVVHTHSTYATVFAQACMSIPLMGTTHADYFYGDIPCFRSLSKEETLDNYERNTGIVICEGLKELTQYPLQIPGALVSHHGPFSWGSSPEQAIYHATVLEKIAELTFKTMMINKNIKFPEYVIEKHFKRKHGPESYYGQC